MTDGHHTASPEREESHEDGASRFDPRLTDLTSDAANRIRHFIADATVKGGASPSEVADLYMSPEIVGNERATAYLDNRYVRGTMPADWRLLEDQLAQAYFSSPPGTSGAELLARVAREEVAERPARSIFDDPDDLTADDDRASWLGDRDPTLLDLTDTGRSTIERHIIAEVLGYGIAPIYAMEIRAALRAAGDDRAIQYFDLPYVRGERPEEWRELRDRALEVRARLERFGRDPSDVFGRAEAAHPGLGARDLLRLIDERAAERPA